MMPYLKFIRTQQGTLDLVFMRHAFGKDETSDPAVRFIIKKRNYARVMIIGRCHVALIPWNLMGRILQ